MKKLFILLALIASPALAEGENVDRFGNKKVVPDYTEWQEGEDACVYDRRTTAAWADTQEDVQVVAYFSDYVNELLGCE